MYQLQGELEWLHTLMDCAYKILTKVYALTKFMIKNVGDRAWQVLGKEPNVLVTLFSRFNIQWLLRNH